MLRTLLPARVVVSVLVAFAFVGGVVAAGAVWRDRDSPARTHPPVVSTGPRTPTRAPGG